MSERIKIKAEVVPEGGGKEVGEMPVIAMRGLVLFPRMVLHFDVGRQISIQALTAAIQGERKIFMVAQRDLSSD